jgi:hypothetical protein
LILVLGFELVRAVLRLGVVLAVYFSSALGGAAIGALSGQEGLQATLLAGGLGLLLVPAALSFGFIAWLMPATVRIYAKGGDPELDYAEPKRADALLLVVVTIGLSIWGAHGLDISVPGVAALALVSAFTIVAIGGAKVAELWGHILCATLEILAG